MLGTSQDEFSRFTSVLVRALRCVLWLDTTAQENHCGVFLATVSGSVSLRATCRSKKLRKCELLRTSAKILRYTYCACLVMRSPQIRYVSLSVGIATPTVQTMPDVI